MIARGHRLASCSAAAAPRSPPAASGTRCAAQPVRPHYLVCNADESEPGTFKDRVLMEDDPFALIEAMTIAGFATGCEQRLPLHPRRVPAGHASGSQAAIDAARARGLPRRRTSWATAFASTSSCAAAPGAYICGEETALFNSIEGFRGEPRNKPPFPVESGLFGKPTVINNVETLVNVLDILARRRRRRTPTIGTERLDRHASSSASPGASRGPGVYEVPFGITLRELLDLAGGVPTGGRSRRSCSAARPGGFVTPDELDIAAHLRGRRAQPARRSARAWSWSFDDTRRPAGDPAAHRRVLPRRVVRPVRALPGRHRAPGGGAAPPGRRPAARLASDGAARCSRSSARSMRDASICGLGQTASQRDRVGAQAAPTSSRRSARR